MNITMALTYADPNLRRLDVIVDDKLSYQAIMNVASGLHHDLPIGEHFLSIKIDAMPLDLLKNYAKARNQ